MAADDGPALGMVETRGLIGAIEAADTMAKTAAVRILRIARTVPALMTVLVTGDVASVAAAVAAGAAAAGRVGQLVSSHIIPNPGDGLIRVIVGEGTVRGTGGDDRSLEDLTVVELRALARTLEEFPIQGRAIASANKQQLLDAFASLGRT